MVLSKKYRMLMLLLLLQTVLCIILVLQLGINNKAITAVLGFVIKRQDIEMVAEKNNDQKAEYYVSKLLDKKHVFDEPLEARTKSNPNITAKAKLQNAVDNATKENYMFLVPNIVHYVWHSPKEVNFTYLYYLSVLSASKFLKPEVIYFHTSLQPIGSHFEAAKKIPNFKIVPRKVPNLKRVFSTTLTNYDRINIVLEMGGIYLDLDVLVIQSFDKLRKYNCTLGYEKGNRVCGGIMIASKDSKFLQLWLQKFSTDYKPNVWAYNSGVVPSRLALEHPELVHIEKTRLHTPNFAQLHSIYGRRAVPWRNNYAVHTWNKQKSLHKRYKHLQLTPEFLQESNSTIGEIARYILSP